MKTNKTNICYFLLIVPFLFFSCKASKGLSKEEVIEQIDAKVEAQRYTFEATQAHPANGRVVHLTPDYTLKVTPDSVIAHLPYFGRAYSAPNPTEEGGIKFISTDFDYSLSEKDKGTYRATIKILDNHNKYELSLLISDNAKGTLYVSQLNKQSITFYGDIE